jgi:hypothetical protein
MIEKLALIKQQGSGIKVVAIDSGVENSIGRDLWMAMDMLYWACDKLSRGNLPHFAGLRLKVR